MTRIDRTVLSTRVVVLLVAALAGLFVSTSQTLGQGTMGMAPDPISEKDLNDYFERLNLTPEQSRAVEAVHARYRERFAELREGDIRRLLTKSREVMGTIDGIPSRDSIAEFIDMQRRVLRRIAAIDNEFFDEVAGEVGLERMVRLERLKLRRERHRYERASMFMPVDYAGVDLAEIVEQVPLSPEQRAAIDAVCESYERRLTRLMAEAHDQNISIFLRLFDALEATGLLVQIEEDMSRTMEEDFQTAMEEAMRPVLAPLVEQNLQVHELARRTERELRAMLLPDQARQLRRMFCDAVTHRPRQAVMLDNLLEAAMEFDQLDDDSRRAITAMAHDYWERSDRHMDELIELSGRLASLEVTMMFDDADISDLHERRKELYKQMLERATQLQSEIEEMVGDERFQELQQLAIGRRQDAAGRAEQRGQIEPVHAQPEQRRRSVQPMSVSELTALARRLDFDATKRAILETLHEEYLQNFHNRISGPVVERYQQLQREQYAWDPETHRRKPVPPGLYSELRELRTSLPTLWAQVEDELLNDIELSLIEESHELLWKTYRTSRELARYDVRNLRRLGGSIVAGGFSGSQEAHVNLFELLFEAELTDVDPERLSAHVTTYAEQVIPIARRTYEAALVAMRAQEEFDELMQKAMESGEGYVWNEEDMRKMREAHRPLAELQSSLTELNRSTLAALISLLPEEAGRALQSAYNREAYPEVFNDSGNLDRVLQAAENLTSLTDQQQEQLKQLANEYREEYSQATGRMLDFYTSRSSHSASPYSAGDEDSVNDWMEQWEARERMMFERSEVNIRYARRLRELLTEEQLRRSGGLPRGLE